APVRNRPSSPYTRDSPPTSSIRRHRWCPPNQGRERRVSVDSTTAAVTAAQPNTDSAATCPIEPEPARGAVPRRNTAPIPRPMPPPAAPRRTWTDSVREACEESAVRRAVPEVRARALIVGPAARGCRATPPRPPWSADGGGRDGDRRARAVAAARRLRQVDRLARLGGGPCRVRHHPGADQRVLPAQEAVAAHPCGRTALRRELGQSRDLEGSRLQQRQGGGAAGGAALGADPGGREVQQLRLGGEGLQIEVLVLLEGHHADHGVAVLQRDDLEAVGPREVELDPLHHALAGAQGDRPAAGDVRL